MADSRVHRAIEFARNAAAKPRDVHADGTAPRPRRFAIGDPQASIEKFFSILDAHALLGEDGLLAPDVELTSIGDHFDYGKTRDEIEQAAEDGTALLAWLACHPPDQARIVAGNHDLARVGELAAFDDERFAAARAEAREVYENGAPEAEFQRRWPEIPTAELAARDYSSFRVAQRDLVVELLRSKRMRAAFADGPATLQLHAGVTRETVERLALSQSASAAEIADALNLALDRAVDAWRPGTPLSIPGLHRAGSAASGEGEGVFYHRPARLVRSARRFDPRRLPAGLTQVVGHTGDRKCRELLGDGWHDAVAPRHGVLRTLTTDGETIVYGHGIREAAAGQARVIFIDGGMSHCATPEYELYAGARP